MNEVIDQTLRGAELVVCCGAGGVGKTSSAAALGMTAASYGRKVVVITIDPARRLAQALGLTALGNDPVQVALPETVPGSVHALMLDPKATFDGMVARTIKQETLQRALQGNHVYKLLTNAFHGMQEYMAVERLFALLEDKRFDLVVLDTPPTTNVLQFFDAPERLARFFDRRIVRWFLPSGEGSRLKRLLSGQSAAMLLIQKVAGEDFARDLQEFFGTMGGLADALSQRAAALGGLLARNSTRYVVVTGPEESRIDETLAMVELLKRRAYRPSAVIVNRVTPETMAPEIAPAAFTAPAALLAEEHSLFSMLAQKLDAQRSALLRRANLERAQIDRLRARLGETLVRVVPRLDVELDSANGIFVLARALA
ncbi:MAG: ArsA family ATPase [Deltaproteobacteria bacterium]|nr:ArsA family ATPase [Deltaproteobacteria bacterium]